jgi:cytochrome c553
MRDFRIRNITILGLALTAAILIAACSSSTPTPDAATETSPVVEDDHEEGEASESEADEHEDEESDDHEHAEVPHEYEDLVNPFVGDAEALAMGAVLFEVTCASCHGATGMGDGAAAAALDPKPATLADSDMMDELSDGYLFWRISEGGAMEPFNSLMPAWGSGFTDDQIWQLVTHIRSLSE